MIVTGTAAVLGASDGEPPLDVEPNALLGELGVFGGRRRRTVVATSPVIAIAGAGASSSVRWRRARIGAHVASLAARRLAERVQPIPATERVEGIVGSCCTRCARSIASSSRSSRDPFHWSRCEPATFAARRPPDSVVERPVPTSTTSITSPWVCVGRGGAGERPLGTAGFIVSADDPAEAEIAIRNRRRLPGGSGRATPAGAGRLVGQARGLEDTSPPSSSPTIARCARCSTRPRRRGSGPT